MNTNRFLANYITLLNYADAAQTWVDTFDNFPDLGRAVRDGVAFEGLRHGRQQRSGRDRADSEVDERFGGGHGDPDQRRPGGGRAGWRGRGQPDVTFAAGAASTKTVNLVGVGRGTTEIALSNGAGVCVGDLGARHGLPGVSGRLVRRVSERTI